MKSLNLLICSANLGNAQPDTDSIDAWLPDDGGASPLLQSEVSHKICSDNDRKQESVRSLKLDEIGPEQEENFFDMIVMGMQEATFEAKRESSTKESPRNMPRHLHQSADNLKLMAKKVSGVGAGVAHKGLSTVQTIVASRNHVKTNKRISNIIPSIGTNVADWVGGTAVLHELILNRLPSYQIIVGFQRGEMRLIILVRNELVEQNAVQVESVKAENTGIASVGANKGGIVANLSVNGTRLSFCTAHLEAHEGKVHYSNRISNLEEILSGTAERGYDFSVSSHFAFFCGDLNFRTVLSGVSKEDHRTKGHELVCNQEWEELNDADELHYALKTKDCLNGFRTLQCNFPPTFKVERQRGYAYKENRTPSYTDRILWKCADRLHENVKPFVYEPIEEFSTSDHKPIRGAFEIKLNKTLKPSPQIGHRIKNKAGKLHLFFNDLRCVDLTARGAMPQPDPYISFVSNPPGLVRKHRTTWKRLKDKMRFGRLQKSDKDGHIVRTSRGWTRTSKKKNTKTPDWSNEEVHLVISTNKADGSAIDVTGAMLFVTVRDASHMMEDNVIGTFALNLDYLYRKSQRHHRQMTESASKSKKNLSSSKSSKNLFGKRKQFRGSKNFSIDDSLNSHSSGMSMKSMKHLGDEFVTIPFNEPLLRNGKEQGIISGSVETWWYHSDLLETAASESDINDLSTSRRKSFSRKFKRQDQQNQRVSRRAGISMKSP